MRLDLEKLRAACIPKLQKRHVTHVTGVSSDAYDVTPHVTPHVTLFGGETVDEGAHVTLRPSVTPEPPGITPVTCVTCQKTCLGFCVEVEPKGHTETPVDNQSFWQPSIDITDADQSFLLAEKGVAYPCAGTVWPDHECADPPTWADLFERLKSEDVKFSVERGHLTRWSPARLDRTFIDAIASHRETLLAAVDGHSIETVVLEVEPWPAADDAAGSVAEDRFAQEAADQKNGAAALAGRTDRYCACGLMATVAVGLAFRPARRNPEGVARWLCDACFADEPDGEPVRHYRSGGRPTEPEPVALKTIERPDVDVARTDWWEQPLDGWAQGKLTISPMVGNETFEIDLNQGE